MLRLAIALALLCCMASVNAQATNAPPTQITSLPLYDGVFPSNQYTGYVNVNETAGREIFYWFVESETDPANAPVLLWLQGGPGCSGLWGMWVEHGPFRLDPYEKQVNLNDYAWTKEANIIFIDQPAGVGFSYAGNATGALDTGDFQAAEDNLAFLEGFFDLFPQYAQNDFWITGESYGGVYVPMLVDEILESSNVQLQTALTGIMIGNPVINCPEMHSGVGPTILIDSYFFHGLVSWEDRKVWYESGCNEVLSPDCLVQLDVFLGTTQPMSGDDLYMNFCTGNGTLDFFDEVPDCISLDDKVTYYFNTPEFQQAIGARSTIFMGCSATLNYDITGQNMLEYYTKFFTDAPNLRIMIYSGDVDIKTCPHSNTQMCLSDLARPITRPWQRWTVEGPKMPKFASSDKNQISAGFVEVHDTYTFATVRGAGHEVPLYQPRLAYNAFQRFIIQQQDYL